MSCGWRERVARTAMAIADLDDDGTTGLVTGQPGGGGANVIFDLAGKVTAMGGALAAVERVGGLGASVVVVDVTGDGILDVVIGSPEENTTGRVYVVAGPFTAAAATNDITAVATITIDGLVAGADSALRSRAGTSIATARPSS